MKKIAKYLPFIYLLGTLPLAVSAQTSTSSGFTIDTILEILKRVLSWFTAIVGIFAILMLLYAAFLFLTSAGNEEKTATAKKTLLYAVIGIAVAILAYVAIGFVSNLLGVNPNVGL
jgi:hypothetical protein